MAKTSTSIVQGITGSKIGGKEFQASGLIVWVIIIFAFILGMKYLDKKFGIKKTAHRVKSKLKRKKRK